MDRRVQPEGIDLDIKVLRPSQSFQRMLEHKEFHVCEMSLASYAILRSRGDCPIMGIPVALSKIFRHSCIYVRTSAGIAKPEDLRGKRVGTAQYSATGIVFMRGMLQHDYGVAAQDMHWFIGGLSKPGEKQRLTVNLPQTVKHEFLPAGQTLENMFQSGEIDVLLTNQIPSLFLQNSPLIARLFPNYREVEQEYFRRTGIFPIMHMVVLRDDVYWDFPWAAASIYKAFCEARDLAVEGLYDTDALRLSLPFLLDHLEETWRVFGKDFWPYGLEANRPTWEAMCRYLFEQKLTARLISADELFAPGIG
jgi:4,5-dihydroxyphthalate decarboxylase